MGKAMTSHRPKKPLTSTRKMHKDLQLKEGTDVKEESATSKILDEKFIAQAVWECLKKNDPEGVLEIIQIHLDVVNKVKASQEACLSRATMYNALKGKNPTLKTLAKLINCFC